MFSPLILMGKYVTKLDGIDNDTINDVVLARKDMKLDDAIGNTFQEDSFFPTDNPASKTLLKKVDEVIKKNVNSYFQTDNQWAHILFPNESTMYHSHATPSNPPGVSWVYYSKTSPKCGNIVWAFDVCCKKVMMEEQPEVGTLIIFPDFVPHFTKKNVSGDVRISISGNARPPESDWPAAAKDPQNVFSYIGVTE